MPRDLFSFTFRGRIPPVTLVSAHSTDNDAKQTHVQTTHKQQGGASCYTTSCGTCGVRVAVARHRLHPTKDCSARGTGALVAAKAVAAATMDLCHLALTGPGALRRRLLVRPAVAGPPSGARLCNDHSRPIQWSNRAGQHGPCGRPPSWRATESQIRTYSACSRSPSCITQAGRRSASVPPRAHEHNLRPPRP